MNGRVAKILRRAARMQQMASPERQLAVTVQNKKTVINHPASVRGHYRPLKRAYKLAKGNMKGAIAHGLKESI